MPRSIGSSNRRSSGRLFAMPAAVAGAALLGLSLLLSVGPALGAANHSNGNGGNGNGNGTSGLLKVHDATTGVETSGNGNEPHVCDFWLGFTSDTSEVGTWIVISWEPTGDGSTVASGTYNTNGDGVDSSSIIDLPAGHYRAEWAATGVTVTNKKTFWVDAECDQAVIPVDDPPTDDPAPPDESGAEDPAPPTDEAGPPVEPPSGEESVPTDEEPPADDPGTPADEPPVEESVPTDEEPPADDPGSPSDESPSEESVLAGDGSPADDPGSPSDESPTGDSPVEEPATGDPGAPTLPSDEEQPAQAQDPGATDPGTPPAQDQLGSSAGSSEATMSDTATPTAPVPTGLLATFGLLLLILAHAATRGGKLSDSARS